MLCTFKVLIMKKLVMKNKYGFYEVSSKPKQSDLEEYYAEKYYQQPNGQYQKVYSTDELKYFANKAAICQHTIKKYLPEVVSFFEVGCGEGFFANEFYKAGVQNIILNDFSEAGIESFNPHLKHFFKKIDIYEHIEEFANQNVHFSLISMDNVLEHVIDPEGLLEKLKLIMRDNSVLRITVPNDFSAFQHMLINEGLTEETWVCPPDHLSYFNSENIVRFCEGSGFQVLSTQCDFPIELFLTNHHSHYYKDRNLGKEAHYSRVLCSNYLVNENIDAYISMSEAAAKLQFGRDVTVYLTLQ